MFRILALSVLALPGVAHAQKFVSADPIGVTSTATPSSNVSISGSATSTSSSTSTSSGSATATSTSTATGTATSTGSGSSSVSVTTTAFNGEIVSLTEISTNGNLVFSGATTQEIEQLLRDAMPNAADSDAQNVIVGRATTDANGDTVITLDVTNSDGISITSSTATPDADQFAQQELGECNPGTNWVSDNIHCYNAFPVGSDN